MDKLESVGFTFHNVSIKTPTNAIITNPLLSFTFHNVSIKTAGGIVAILTYIFFTFHNVSIKTRLNSSVFNSSVRLYIPQCFY